LTLRFGAGCRNGFELFVERHCHGHSRQVPSGRGGERPSVVRPWLAVEYRVNADPFVIAEMDLAARTCAAG